MKKRYILLLFCFVCSLSLSVFGQEKPDLGTIHGSLQSDAQYTFVDSTIGAEARPEKILSNSYLQLLYQRGKIEVGTRFEIYQTPLLGFDPRYTGLGIANKYARYRGDFLDITVGNFYEQFGNGSILRAYQEWALGIDNSIEGLRVKVKPTKGVVFTALVGKQRAFWEKSKGIVRAGDMDINLNAAIPAWEKWKSRYSFGASVVSVYQADDNPSLKLPQNVAAFSGRAAFTRSAIHFEAEGAYKANDPDATNKFVYNTGNQLYAQGSYSKKGFAISAAVKRVDNMNFRSDRNANFNSQTLSFLPPITKTHTYRLPTLYPYATQPNGEFGGQVNVYYRIKKGTKAGGKYGWQFAVNYARVNGLDTTHLYSKITDTTGSYKYLYKSSFWGDSNKFYFQDFNIEISKKWSDKFKQTLTYVYLTYNKDVVQKGSDIVEFGTIHSHNIILESSYEFDDKNALRTELQHMYVEKKNGHQDFGNWAMLMAEYSVSPHWYFTAFDEYNYGNSEKAKRVHYVSTQISYIKDSHRIAIGYGRQREGLLCVGGICRAVPASNGFTISFSSTF